MIFDDFNLDEMCEKIKGLKKSDVQHILNWASLQPHLPSINEIVATFFLHSSEFSCEKAKKFLDNYYTFRTHLPEVFSNLDPRSESLLLAQKTSIIGVLPKLTPEKYIVSIARLADTDPANFDFPTSVTFFDMAAAVYGHSLGYIHGQLLVVDLAGSSLQHLLKINPVLAKKLMHYMQEGVPVKLKGIHIINPAIFMDAAMSILKAITKKELIELIQIHTSYDSFYKVIPRECLTFEWGGNVCTFKDVQEKTSRLLMENLEYFKMMESKRVDESKRLGKPKNLDEIFGLDGTFKKLDID